MEELITLINMHTHNMGRILGHSDEQAIRECTVKELLLYLGTLMAMADKPDFTEVTPPVKSPEELQEEANEFLLQVARER